VKPIDTSDPYAVLEVDPTATWDDIVDAHRSMARRHHPDRLVDGTDAERTAGEARIRAVNAAYAELKVRRGR
jgi:DnaJ like chaperone protein